jgi:trimethylamine--corrinoid protein Co-methyltransferase
LDVIRDVGHDGTFLAEMHTVRHFREELWFPQLLDREFWSTWMEEGASTMHERCIALKDKILREHVPVPLNEDVAREVDRIVAVSKRALGTRR